MFGSSIQTDVKCVKDKKRAKEGKKKESERSRVLKRKMGRVSRSRVERGNFFEGFCVCV